MSSSTGRALRQPSRTSTTILNENDDDDFMDIDFMNGSHLQQIATVVSRNNGNGHYSSVTSPNSNNGHSSGSSSSISSSQHHHRPRHGSNSQPPLHPHHRSHNRSHHRSHHRVHQNLSRNGSSSGSSSSRSTSPLNRIVSDAGGGGPGYHLAHNCAYSQPLSPTNITCGSPNCENQSPKLLPSYEQTQFQRHSPPAVVNGFGSYSSASSSITPSTSPNCLYDYDNSNNRPPSSSTDCDQVHHLHHHQSPSLHLHNHNHHQQHGLSSTCSSASSSFNSKSSSGFSSSANGTSASTITNGASHGYGPTNGSYVINGHGRAVAKSNSSYTSTGQLVHHRPTCPQHPSNMHQPNCPLAPASKPSAPSDMDYLSINPSNPVKPESDMITIAPPPPALLEASAQKKKPQPRHELIEFSFLLPNGCFLTLVVYDDATLKDVKHELWIKYKAMVKELQQPTEPPADEKTATPGSKVASRLRALRSRAFGSKNSDSTNNSSTTSPTTNTNNTVVTSIARQSLSELFASSMPPSQTMPAINNNNNNNRNSAPVGGIVQLDEPKKQKSKRRLSFSFKKRSPSLNLGKFNFWGGSSGGSSAGAGAGVSLEKRSGETAKIISPTTSPDLGYETLTSITSPTITIPLARSMSVRKRMIQSLFPKWNKNGSMRSTSVSIPVTSNAKATNVVPDSSAHSTPTSPVGYVPSLTYPTSLQLTSPFDSNNNNPNQVPIIEEAEPLKPPNSLLLTTTASMVLPDFGDGHDAFSRAVPPSAGRLAALANEDSSDYVFAGITLEGKMEEFYDDTVKLFDLNLFMPVLRLVEAIGNKKEKLLNHIVSSIIGKPLNELDSIRTDEFRQYRHRMHSTMLETVQEREELSIDERLFYEFPPELDDIDTLTLSTKRVTENLDEFESFFCEDETPDNSSSRETLVSFPSYESLNVVGGGAAGGSPGMRTTKSESDTLTTGTGISRNSSNDRLIELPNIAPNGSEEDKPVYTEVVALKRSRFFHSFKKSEHVPPTEYPMLLLADSSSNSNRNRNRKKNSDSVDAAPHPGPGPRAKMAILIRPEDEEIDENIVVIKSGRNNGSRQAKPTTKKIVKSDSNLTDDLKEQAAVAANSSDTAEPAMSSSLQSLTKKMQESQQLHPKGENTDYGDHYELCFDRRQDINSLQPPRPVRIAFNIWTSLATVMHGASNGDISNCGDLGPLLQLFDEMTNAENAAKEALKAVAAAKKLSDSQAAKTNGKNGKTKSSHPSTSGSKPPSEPRKKSKSATSKLFGRLFRSPKPSSLNVIKEGVSQDAQQQKKSKVKQPTLMSSPIESPISPPLSSSSSSSSQVITTTNNKATTISGKLQFEDPTQSPSPTLPHTTNQDTNTLVISPSAAANKLTEDNANASSGDSGSEIDPTGMPQDGTSLATSPTIDLSVQLSPSQPIFAAVQSITTSPVQSGALVPIGSTSLTSQRTTIFESRPHLLPQLYQVKCQPEGTVPRELSQRLLRQYCIWLRARLQGMLTQLQQKAAAAHQQVHSASSSSSSSSGGVHISATASLSKTITKFLSPKSPSSSSTTSSSSGTKSSETDTSAYVEMNYSPSSDNSSTSPGTITTTTTTNTSPSSPSTEHTSQLGSTVTLQTTTDLASLSTSSNTSPSSLSSTPTSPATPTTPDSLNSPFAEEIAKVKHLLERLEHNKLYLNPDRYLMKICGYEQYLLGDYSLMMFDYIRNCVSKGKTPQLMLISKLAIVEKIPSYLYVQPYFLRRLSMQYHHHPPFNSSNILLSSSGGFHLSKFATQAREKLLLMANDESGKLSTNKSSDHRGRLNQRRSSLQAPTQLSLTVSTTQLSSSVDKDSHLATAVANENQTSSQTSSAVADSDTNYAVICANQTMRQKHHHRRRKESIDSSMTSSVDSTLDTSADTLDLEASTLCLASKASSSSIAEKSLTAKNDKQQTAVERSQKLKEKSNLKKNISFDSSLDSAKTTPKDDTEDDDDNSLDSWIDHGIVHKNLISLWKISTVFRVRVLLATYVNVKDVDRIYVQAGIYHGSEPLCQHQCTKQVEPQNPRWDQMLEFPELCFLDLPLSSRLSIALCAVVNRRKPHEEFATAWINLQLFNYKRCLLSGRISLNLWPMPNGFEGFLNPFGHSGTNPNRYQAPRIQIEFDTFPRPVVYPPRSAILEYANVVSKQEEQFIQQLEDMDSRNEELPNMIETRMLVQYPKLECLSFFENCSINRFFRCKTSFRWIVKQLRKLTSRLDPFAALSEQEKDFFWRERETVMKACPDALPKVLESVRWSCREEVCQMYELLGKWPTVSVDTSIILLGGRYIDTMIREFAIHSLDVGLTDGLMVHYLLQLIQLLKNEPHHDNALARLLLRRALLNRRFGHLFFWNLRSQINDSICTARWCVLLEMYCRGLSQTALRTTLQQVEALDEIERISNETINEADRREAIMKQFTLSNVLVKVSKFYNPLNITIPLDQLMHEKCRVMDSAKRPLWLEWTNSDPFAKHNGLNASAVIFKTGDDLRQDMLTLQVIRIMDLIWRRQNLDLKMLPYNCLATGNQVGLIEVVSHAQTVMGIQRCGGRMAALQVDNSKLHKWIKDHNLHNYEHAVDNFTRSCAGYCVATFILGIGDRNPDNIMVNEDGQIFHIDFGHFLGHFKKKFGINRERVPFVLTYDFLQVITKGADDPLKSKEFEAFQRLCYDAYLALHDNAQLLISLFIMMLGTGIPELQTLEDVQYLRQTLQVDKTREEALQYFETQLDEAHGGAWSTKLDWFFHSVKHA